ncbi:MAG: type II secretion system protein [Gallionellaceae bacterium]|nr:MAG: type II secretion system protein [Gallionellaceae bacterium]
MSIDNKATSGVSASLRTRHSALGTRYSKGFSLIELVIVVAIVSLLMSVLLDRVWYYQEMAEKTAMEETVGALQSALSMRHGKNYVRGNPDDISPMSTENPMKWLQKLPRNYSGEFYDPSPRSVAPGNWVFDLRTRELIYVPDRTEHFVPGKDGKKWVRFHVNVQYEQVVRGGINEGGKELVGTVFEPTEPVNWF